MLIAREYPWVTLFHDCSLASRHWENYLRLWSHSFIYSQNNILTQTVLSNMVPCFFNSILVERSLISRIAQIITTLIFTWAQKSTLHMDWNLQCSCEELSWYTSWEPLKQVCLFCPETTRSLGHYTKLWCFCTWGFVLVAPSQERWTDKSVKQWRGTV